MSKRRPITFWATVFVAVVCLSLVAIDGWRSWNARTQQLLEVERSATNLARAMAQQADDTIKAADTSLADIVERIEVDGAAAPALARLQRVLRGHVAELPQLNGLFVYDADGAWLVNSRPEPLRERNNADREYFQFHRADPARGAHIGTPVVSRSSGKWVVPVSRRINRADGGFAGVALATIDVDYFKRFYQSFDIGQRGAVALTTNAGTLLLRRPFDDATIGMSMARSALYLAYRGAGPVGSVFLESPLDGEVRLNSYRALQHYPLFATAALSKDEQLANWRRDTFLHSLGVLLLAALLGLFGKRLVQQIGLRVEAEAQLLGARDALESLNRQLEKLALQDGLTGLANRRQFDATLAGEFSLAGRAAAPLAFIMLDVDCFKQYNDHYGHIAGDACLRALSQCIVALMPGRRGELAARYGGEEIGILLPDTGLDEALALAERVRAAIEGLRIGHRGSPAGVVTVSAGVAALLPRRGAGAPARLLEAADKALYAAKLGGRNRVCAAAAAPACA
ncbi:MULTISPECIES: GGDEF domain-containing protein [unclassified Janthinobacterium]|uniref:GGDEF domain-containing protein n=1 Tax=unclassified Janthinobacterium TaxID=2610881 RepID=UPI00034D8F09|nr:MULTISPECIES: sensor domain-containing diguanylate cyclase [unclassified Janthinobacterium]MEC5159806.1 diguanylate cyclase (GGDEF)-like protein [Janthinobacterium sp. CG_S6]